MINVSHFRKCGLFQDIPSSILYTSNFKTTNRLKRFSGDPRTARSRVGPRFLKLHGHNLVRDVSRILKLLPVPLPVKNEQSMNLELFLNREFSLRRIQIHSSVKFFFISNTHYEFLYKQIRINSRKFSLIIYYINRWMSKRFSTLLNSAYKFYSRPTHKFYIYTHRKR